MWWYEKMKEKENIKKLRRIYTMWCRHEKKRKKQKKCCNDTVLFI